MASALNAQPLLLGELSAENSRQLLAYILGEQRVQAEEAAVAQIGTRLHYLPLAVEIVAQRLKSRPRQPLVQMAERLQSEEHRLGLEISDRAVRTSFAVSWQALAAPLQRTFALLAVFAGRPFTAAAIAHIADEKISVIEDRLYSLEALSLVKAEGATYYRQHPLLADFASEKLLDADAACARMADYYHILNGIEASACSHCEFALISFPLCIPLCRQTKPTTPYSNRSGRISWQRFRLRTDKPIGRCCRPLPMR